MLWLFLIYVNVPFHKVKSPAGYELFELKSSVRENVQQLQNHPKGDLTA